MDKYKRMNHRDHRPSPAKKQVINERHYDKSKMTVEERMEKLRVTFRPRFFSVAEFL